MKFRATFTLAVSAALLAGFAGSASADATPPKRHPRRAQVVARDKNLKDETTAANSSGKINDKQAAKLEKQEDAIHTQEKADAAANSGHITKAEQRDLNREERGVKKEMQRDERRDAQRAAKAPAAPAATHAPTN